jgi:hypothetical protein
MLEIDVAPSGVGGRKLDALVFSVSELTLSAAMDDSVGVTDEALMLLELVELGLPLPDDAPFVEV